jgi:hypothetical protein
MKSIINIENIEQINVQMGRIISTIIICYVAVTYYPLEGIRTVIHHPCCHATIENHSTGSAAPRSGRPEQSEQYPVDTGDCTDTSNEKSPAADGLP